MSSEILRGRVGLQEGIVVDTTAAGCTPIRNENAAMLMVKRTSGSAATYLVFGSPTQGGTYLQMTFDGSDLGGAISDTDWEVLPNAIYPASWIKLVTDVAGVVDVAGKG